MSEKLLAYHGSHKLKAEVIADMKADIEAERLVSGEYWTGEQGCHIGCVLHARSLRTGTSVDHEDHGLYEHHIGVPRELAHMFDGLFESLPDGQRQQFSLDVLNAITPGTDLSDVVRQWLIWLLYDVRQYACYDKDVLSAIDNVVSLLEERCQDGGRWAAARKAAWDATSAATRDAARDAAWTAGSVAASAATRDAAWAAAWVATRDAAWDTARDAQAKKLLELLVAVPRSA